MNSEEKTPLTLSAYTATTSTIPDHTTSRPDQSRPPVARPRPLGRTMGDAARPSQSPLLLGAALPLLAVGGRCHLAVAPAATWP